MFWLSNAPGLYLSGFWASPGDKSIFRRSGFSLSDVWVVASDEREVSMAKSGVWVCLASRIFLVFFSLIARRFWVFFCLGFCPCPPTHCIHKFRGLLTAFVLRAKAGGFAA